MFGLNIFTMQLNFIIRYVGYKFNVLVMSLFFKFLCVAKIFILNDQKLLLLCYLFVSFFLLKARVCIFFEKYLNDSYS